MKSLLFFRLAKRKFYRLRRVQSSRVSTCIFISVAILVFLSPQVKALSNPNVRSPVDSSTTPVGGGRGGMIRSGSVDTSGNDIITGNVRGGKYFHGFVPYYSPTSTETTLPSASIRDFVRDSAGVEDIGTYPGRYSQSQPFYYPSQTATFTRPGYNKVFTPTDASAVEQADTSVMGGLIQPASSTSGFVFSGAGGSSFNVRSLPMSRTLPDIERIISTDVGRYTGSRGLPTYTESIDEGVISPGTEQTSPISPYLAEGKRALEQMAGKTYDLKASPTERSDTMQSQLVGTAGEPAETPKAEGGKSLFPHPYTEEATSKKDSQQAVTAQQAAEWETLADRTTGMTSLREKGMGYPEIGTKADTYEQIKKRIEDLQKSTEKPTVPAETGDRDYGKTSTLTVETASDKNQSVQPGLQDDFNTRLQSARQGTRGEGQKPGELRSTVSRPETGGKRQAVGSLQGASLKSFTESKYNQYIEAAQLYMKQGRYYWAVSAYTLASAYKSDDLRAYAGKSYALFAAGEYISSALFLSRALDISPEYAKTNVDLVSILGGRDNIEKRITDVKEWLKNSDAAELQFLLGYVYYRIGELAEAKEMIDAAYKKMPDAKSIAIVKKAIDDAMSPSAAPSEPNYLPPEPEPLP